MNALLRGRATQPLLQAASVALASLVVGMNLSRLPTLSPKAALVVFLGAPVCLFLGLRHPKWTVVTLCWLTLFGVNASALAVGPVSLRAIDFPVAVLALWALVRAAQGVRPLDIGQRSIYWFFFALFATTVPNLVRNSGSAVYSLEAFFRLVESVFVFVFVPLLVPTAADRRFVVRGVLFGCVGAVALPLAGIHGTGLFSNERLAGFTSVNSTGLVSVLAIVLAARDARLPRLVQFGSIAVGLVGLFATRSVGSLSALGLTFSLFGLTGTSERLSARSRNLVRPAKFAVGALAVIFLVMTLRPSNLPTNEDFATSTTSHRVVLGFAGLEIFWQNPVIGVGWGRSSLTEVIGAEKVVDSLSRRFQNVNPTFLPDVNPSSVHNLYIEILAEAGVVGFLALALCAFSVRKRVRRVLAACTGPDFVTKWTAWVALITILIWYNDNAVFGAQPESVLIGVFLGVIAAPAVNRGVRAESSATGDLVESPDPELRP